MFFQPHGNTAQNSIHILVTDGFIIIIQVRDLDQDQRVSASVHRRIQGCLQCKTIQHTGHGTDRVLFIFDGKQYPEQADGFKKQRQKILLEKHLYYDRYKRNEQKSQK